LTKSASDWRPPEDPREIVRRGYNAVSTRYDEKYGSETKYRAWLDELRQQTPPGGAVLDLGCGSGLPVARDLTAAGYRVTGVDISEVQIRRASQLVPAAQFVRADITAIEFEPASFDLVVSFFALIHVPVDDQPPLLLRIARWLRPGGLFVATTGYGAWTGTEETGLAAMFRCGGAMLTSLRTGRGSAGPACRSSEKNLCPRTTADMRSFGPAGQMLGNWEAQARAGNPRRRCPFLAQYAASGSASSAIIHCPSFTVG